MIMKKLRKIFSFIITILLLIVLFGVIFVSLGFADLGASFFIELSIVAALMIVIRITWYENIEDNRMEQEDIKKAKDDYDDSVDVVIEDVDHFEQFLKILDKENKQEYINYRMGGKTPYLLGIKKYNRLYKKYRRQAFRKFKGYDKDAEKNRVKYINDKLDGRTAKSIGQIKYDKLLNKYSNRADKIKPLKSSDIMTRGNSKLPYDSKNYQNQKKRTWEITSTIFSICLSITLAAIAFREILLSWENVFKYLMYVYAIVQTIFFTVYTANKNTYTEFMDHLSRLSVILKKYESYKKGGDSNGESKRT